MLITADPKTIKARYSDKSKELIILLIDGNEIVVKAGIPTLYFEYLVKNNVNIEEPTE